jgi:ATP-dependent Zn protease
MLLLTGTAVTVLLDSTQVSSGATDDLRQATNMARHMVMQCGLNDELGPLYIEDEKHLSESLKQQVDAGALGLQGGEGLGFGLLLVFVS